jgi:hypothetical protein
MKIPPLATSSPVENLSKNHELQWRRVQTLKNCSRIPTRSSRPHSWRPASGDDLTVQSARIKSKSQLSLTKSMDTPRLNKKEKSDFFLISKIAGEKIYI